MRRHLSAVVEIFHREFIGSRQGCDCSIPMSSRVRQHSYAASLQYPNLLQISETIGFVTLRPVHHVQNIYYRRYTFL
jgi:hypothetical protein